ncbi:MAG: CheB methylesterase domain-containing protein [Pseudomonadota bacterium]
MNIILTVSNPHLRDRMRGRLNDLDGVHLSKTVVNLTAAYHEAEHHPPNVALFSHSLTLLPEFEVLVFLLRSLNVAIGVVVEPDGAPKTISGHLGATEFATLHEAMSDAELSDALRNALDRRVPARSAPTSPAEAAATAVPGRLIMIGSSTGGVEALIKVLGSFGPTCPPTMLVQHTGGSFSGGLARLLNSKSPASVCEATHNMILEPGMVALAPGDSHHLEARIRGNLVRCQLVAAPEMGGHRPAVDRLFKSGIHAAPKIAAAILTGMGKDGADGLLALKRAGARTYGQDEKTSLVYGMPKAAADIGAVDRQLPLDRIGPALISASSERTAA